MPWRPERGRKGGGRQTPSLPQGSCEQLSTTGGGGGGGSPQKIGPKFLHVPRLRRQLVSTKNFLRRLEKLSTTWGGGLDRPTHPKRSAALPPFSDTCLGCIQHHHSCIHAFSISSDVHCGSRGTLRWAGAMNTRLVCRRCGAIPLCDIPSGCSFFPGPWTVTSSSLRVLRQVVAF